VGSEVSSAGEEPRADSSDKFDIAKSIKLQSKTGRPWYKRKTKEGDDDAYYLLEADAIFDDADTSLTDLS
jgi:hypothetical protein